jgi:hypothetical protein
MARWEILYSYRERPDRVLWFATHATRTAARAALAAMVARRVAQWPAQLVEWDGPDSVVLETRTAFSVRRARTHDALGRRVVRLLAVAGLAAGLAFGGAAPVAAHHGDAGPGAECFRSAHPGRWQHEIDRMGPAQLETLDACLDAAGWDRTPADDDAGPVPAGWPCAYDPATVDALTPAARAQLVACLDAFGWDHDDAGTGDGTGR